MDIEIPAVPVGVLTLLTFFAPYALAIVNRPNWSGTAKRVVSAVAAVVLAGLVMGIYFAATGDMPDSWWMWVLWSVTVVSASYALFTGPTANMLADRVHGTGFEDPDTGFRDSREG